MRYAIALFFLAGMLGTAEAQQSKKPIRLAIMCMFSYEQSSGFNKICYYDCLGSQAAITISNTSLCPQTINR